MPKRPKPLKVRARVAYEMITGGNCHSRQIPDKRKEADKRACKRWTAE